MYLWLNEISLNAVSAILEACFGILFQPKSEQLHHSMFLRSNASNLFYLKYVNHCETKLSVILGNLTNLTNIVIFIYS